MDYEKKYKELEGKIKKAYLYAQTDSTKAVLEDILPELKESEDEKIRKEIVRFIQMEVEDEIVGNKWLAWLEKQGDKPQGKTALEAIKKKPVDNANKVERKFKVGDWIIFNEHHNSVYQVEKIQGLQYYLKHYNGGSMSVHIDSPLIRLWTIADAKDGDVLVASDGSIFIFAGVDVCACKYYVALTTDNYVKINKEAEGGYWETSRAVHPATKEQRDILKKAMNDAGWQFDFERKELKKIESNPAWSEEDEQRIKKVMHIISCDGRISNEECKSIFDWLKSLKDRVGCEANCTTTKELSESDEEEFQIAIDTLVEAGQRDSAHWLESIKDRVQPHWKPSEKQLDALQYVYRNCNPPLSDKLGWDSIRTLELMYQDLKKLKEE